MEKVKEVFSTLLENSIGEKIESIESLPKEGSDRNYYRIITIKGNKYVGTYNINVKENLSFIYFSNFFSQKNLKVPTVFAVDSTNQYYIQSDLGNLSLLDKLKQEGFTEKSKNLYKKALMALSDLQIKGDEGLNYSNCFSGQTFDSGAIMADLLYFKYYFLRTLKIVYDGPQLIKDFDTLADFLGNVPNKFFLMRDCQARNIMVQDEEVVFIDYQGGKKGPLPYDVASLLWQAKAELSWEWKSDLTDFYIDHLKKEHNLKIESHLFKSQLNGFVLIRLLQVLGAYGFRGLFEKRTHFLESIPQGLRNLKLWLEKCPLTVEIPELTAIIEKLIQPDFIRKYEINKATPGANLVVEINSFSYKKGLPSDASNNGGGFIFDCRSILNPGRFEAYKKLTGKDKPVSNFLVNNEGMEKFLQNVKELVGQSVENYLERDFSNLQVNFGCTGGQHRSVYCAEALNKFLIDKYGVKTILNHNNEINWPKVDAL